MAHLSDQLLMWTILGYTLAMLGYAVEYSFGAKGAVARVATAPRQRELVSVGGPERAHDPLWDDPDGAVAEPEPAVVVPVSTGEKGRRAALFGRVAVVLTVLATLTHGGVLVTRGLAAHRVPWGNMYEFVLAACFVGALSWLVVLVLRPTARLLGLFVSLAMVILLGFAMAVLHTQVAPLVPALNSYWLKIHVSAAASSSGILLMAFIPSALFLAREGWDRGKRSFPYSLGRRLPAADSLERLAFRVTVFAFPLWTFAIICGAIWAEAAWGRYWGWDPKETWSFISWVVYAGYLHARATPSVRKTTATWIAVAAWITMLINLYVINFVAVGMHSYAGV
ncbi:c-type cytochrome biogenesis protein CcsB [Luedemannella flava]|uniref:C-type cytochrome biogenesis protein CcsB n=1 Tax=Luedemannella flava TaxID=349316 RepID=A0ABN2MB74_9ACTN